MASSLTLKTDQSPGYLNKDLVIGGLIGGLLPGGIFLAPVGAVVGSVLGKNRTERENREGKPVGTPSLLNKDMVLGGLIGTYLASGVAMLAGLGVTGAGVAIGAGTTAAVGGALLAGSVAAIAAGIGSIAVGAYIGGKMGKTRQSEELAQAKQQLVEQLSNRTPSQEAGPEMEYAREGVAKEWAKARTDELSAVQGRGGR